MKKKRMSRAPGNENDIRKTIGRKIVKTRKKKSATALKEREISWTNHRARWRRAFGQSRLELGQISVDAKGKVRFGEEDDG